MFCTFSLNLASSFIYLRISFFVILDTVFSRGSVSLSVPVQLCLA